MSFIYLLRTETSPASDEVEGLMLHAGGRASATAARLEAQWALFERLAERGFIKNFRLNPHQRWWEMYLGSELVRTGLDVARSGAPNGAGPDFIVKHDGRTICIECVCPGRGDEPNPERMLPMVFGTGEARICPEEQMTLRIQQSISDKARSFRKYMTNNVIPEGSRNIVAVSCSELDHPREHVMAGSVLPIGPQTMFASNDSDDVEVRFVRKTEIARQKSKPRSMTGFEDGTLSHLAGVMFYPGSLFGSSVPEGGLHLLRNPTAQIALPGGALPFVQEWN